MMGLKTDDVLPVVRAALVSSTGASSRRYATLSAGASDGVANGQPVVGPDGLVGRIVSVGRVSARVLLIVDGGNVTPVKRSTDGAPALAIGTGDVAHRIVDENPPVAVDLVIGQQWARPALA